MPGIFGIRPQGWDLNPRSLVLRPTGPAIQRPGSPFILGAPISKTEIELSVPDPVLELEEPFLVDKVGEPF